MYFDILDEITDVKAIAVDSSIRELARLRKVHGPGRWRKLKGFATVRVESGFITKAELHWYECHGIGKRIQDQKISGLILKKVRLMKHQLVICVKNEGYEASLEIRKLYEVVSDPKAEEHQQIRVIDESGEDYLFPKEFFVEIEIPKIVEEAIFRVA